MEDLRFCIYSEGLAREVPVRVLRPEKPSGRWLLLLHGYGGDENEWVDHSEIASLARKYRLTVVMPGCGDGYYEDTREPIGRFLGEELSEYLHTHFSLSDRCEDAAIAGVSMGGFGALLLGSRYSRVFGRIACLSGAFIIHDVAIGNPGVLRNADVRYFRRVFGDFETLEGSDRDPVEEARRAVREQRMSPVYLLCGTGDMTLSCTQRVRRELERMGAAVTAVTESGGHSWDFWNRHLDALLQWLTE